MTTDDETDEQRIEFDYEVVCPRRSCGSINIRIDKPPRPGRWYSLGRACCLDCGAVFSLQAVEDETK